MAKRKRASPFAEIGTSPSDQRPPPHETNPFSRSSRERRQLSLAGVTDWEDDPSAFVRGFPHRGGSWMDGDDSEDPSPKSTKTRSVNRQHYNRQFDLLLRAVHQLLDHGEIAKSANIFGLLMRKRPGSRPLDVRQSNIWALGAEIILREGEDSTRNDEILRDDANVSEVDIQHIHVSDNPSSRASATWPLGSNLRKLRAYFDTLTQKYPYDHKFPRNISALDFNLALFGCEIYACHSRHNLALKQLEDHGDFPFRQESSCEGEGVHPQSADEAQGSSRISEYSRSNNIRILHAATCEMMSDIAARMDNLIRERPYSRNSQFLQLRATVSLLLADLSHQDLTASSYPGGSQAVLEQHTARGLMRKIVRNGGRLDEHLLALAGRAVNADQGEIDNDMLYSQLPIRGS